jgi:hypothetical protein
MKEWRRAGRAALVSGSVASVVSTAMAALCGRQETGSAVAPTNATSHWVWGDRAARQDAPSVRYTALGYLIHHAAAVFWATFFERWFGRARERGDVRATVGGAVLVAALACVVDYRFTPQRLTPGYEKRLSRLSLLAVYTAFAAGLALTVLVPTEDDPADRR